MHLYSIFQYDVGSWFFFGERYHQEMKARLHADLRCVDRLAPLSNFPPNEKFSSHGKMLVPSPFVLSFCLKTRSKFQQRKHPISNPFCFTACWLFVYVHRCKNLQKPNVNSNQTQISHPPLRFCLAPKYRGSTNQIRLVNEVNTGHTLQKSTKSTLATRCRLFTSFLTKFIYIFFLLSRAFTSKVPGIRKV